MKSHITATSLVLITLLAAGCGGGSDNIGPTNTASGNGNPTGATPPTPNATTTALFQPLQGVLPYPTDLYFKDSKDGTLNIQPTNPLMPLQSGVNALDGFSTTAVIRTRFAGPLSAASLTAANIRVIELELDNTTKAPKPPNPVRRPLVLGTDFSVGLASDKDVGNTILEIRPLKPLTPSSGATNIGYLVILTNGITTADGKPTTPDDDYAAFKSALPACGAPVAASLTLLCQLTGAQLQIAQAVGVNPANVVLTFSFSTQATRDTMNALAQPSVTKAQPILVQKTPATTQTVVGSLPGHADIYVGTFTIPYYLTRPTAANPRAPLTQPWQGNPSPLDATSRFLTRFNPLPVATETLQIPIFITVPNAASVGGGAKPASGWPVIIFQHGLTRDRIDAVAIADAAADAGYVVASIDLPLHGIPGPNAIPDGPFYQAGRERTFDLDLVTNSTLTGAPDGQIDPSGTHFVNVPVPIVTRDNLRQAAVDLLALTRSLPNLDLDGDGTADIDPTRVHYIGHSLGAIVGGVFLGAAGAAEVRTGELANPGGGVAQTIFDSPAFGPSIKQGLAAQNVIEGSTIYAQFIRDAQTIVDAGDPVNYIATAASVRPLLVFQVVGGGMLPNGSASPPDQVVVNSATQRLIDAANIPRVFAAGNNPGPLGYVNFILGNHGSIIGGSATDPTTNLDVTAEMQRESIVFASSLGSVIQVTNTAVVQQ